MTLIFQNWLINAIQQRHKAYLAIVGILVLSMAQLDAFDGSQFQDLQSLLSDPKVKALLDKQQVDLDKVSTVAELVEKQKTQRQERDDFYRDYVTKYYPKASVICQDYFLTMTPEQIADSLHHVVDIFTEQPWFYFVDRSSGFKLIHYWEYIVDQLSLINDFLHKARVWRDKNTLWYPCNDEELLTNWASGGSLFKDTQPLYDYIARLPQTSYYDFYALCFDYVIKLFNEGVLLQSPGQAILYFSELEAIKDKLCGSGYDAEYDEHLKTAKRLLSNLKQHLGIDHDLELKKMGRFGQGARL